MKEDNRPAGGGEGRRLYREGTVWRFASGCIDCQTQDYTVGLQHFYGKGPHMLLRADSRFVCGVATISSAPNCLIAVYVLWCIRDLKMWPRAA